MLSLSLNMSGSKDISSRVDQATNSNLSPSLRSRPWVVRLALYLVVREALLLLLAPELSVLDLLSRRFRARALRFKCEMGGHGFWVYERNKEGGKIGV